MLLNKSHLKEANNALSLSCLGITMITKIYGSVRITMVDKLAAPINNNLPLPRKVPT